MESRTASRLWNSCKAAKRPWPVLDEDDVIDFMVMEAVAVRMAREEKEEAKAREQAQERDSWKKDKEGLSHLREVASGSKR